MVGLQSWLCLSQASCCCCCEIQRWVFSGSDFQRCFGSEPQDRYLLLLLALSLLSVECDAWTTGLEYIGKLDEDGLGGALILPQGGTEECQKRCTGQMDCGVATYYDDIKTCIIRLAADASPLSILKRNVHTFVKCEEQDYDYVEPIGVFLWLPEVLATSVIFSRAGPETLRKMCM